MQRGFLAVSKGAQLPCFLENHRIRHDRLVFWLPKVGADLTDKGGNVIEQAFRWKDAALINGQKLPESIEPASRQRTVLRMEALGDEISEIRDDHIELVNMNSHASSGWSCPSASLRASEPTGEC